MAGWRYRVSDLPSVGVSAFTPIPTTNPVASSHGLVRVEAEWGTDAVPSPRPAAMPSLTSRPAGSVDSAQGSAVSPDYFAPAIAVAFTDHMGPERGAAGIGMARRRMNELPVPAVDPTRLPTVAQGSRKTGGRTVMAWPRAFQRWPIIGSQRAG